MGFKEKVEEIGKKVGDTATQLQTNLENLLKKQK